MEHTHQIIKCRHCGDVILQCKCTDVDKEISFVTCNPCHLKSCISEYVVKVRFTNGTEQEVKVAATNEEEAKTIIGARFRLSGRKVKDVENV